MSGRVTDLLEFHSHSPWGRGVLAGSGHVTQSTELVQGCGPGGQGKPGWGCSAGAGGGAGLVALSSRVERASNKLGGWKKGRQV